MANCANTAVMDLSPLKDHKKLKFVWVEGAPIADTSVKSVPCGVPNNSSNRSAGSVDA